MKYKESEFGSIPEHWKVLSTIEYCNIITDYVANGSFKSLADNVNYNQGEKYAVLIRLTDYHNGFSGDFVHIDKQAYDFLGKTKLFGEEIVIANVGANVGTVFLVPKLNRKMSLGPNSIMIKTKGNDKFYYYWFKSRVGQGSLQSIITGSAQPKFNKTAFRKLNIPVPPMREQNEIAKILSSLDDKIELNNKINKNLEELAQTLYKRWFVEFEFPNDDGEPYKSSGGEMVESELGLIPKGWDILTLESRFAFERGVEPGSKSYVEHKTKDSVAFYRVGDLDQKKHVFVNKSLIKNKCVDEKDILVSFDGAIGRVGIGFKGSYSTGLRKVYDKNKEITEAAIYFIMKSDGIQDTMRAHANGTTILHAGSSIPFLKIPFDKQNYSIFDNKVSPIFNKLIQIINENKKLIMTRDELLPKLMNGEIEVPIEE